MRFAVYIFTSTVSSFAGWWGSAVWKRDLPGLLASRFCSLDDSLAPKFGKMLCSRLVGMEVEYTGIALFGYVITLIMLLKEGVAIHISQKYVVKTKLTNDRRKSL